MKSLLTIQKWWKSLSGRLLPLSLLLLVSMSMAGCTGSKILSQLVGGGGPKVAANVQAGKTNNQTVGTNTTVAPSVSLRPKARVDMIDQSSKEGTVADKIETINNTNVSPWMVLLLVLGWLAPSPGEIARWVRSLFKRN